jgi:two-component system, CitB family, sensor kinase
MKLKSYLTLTTVATTSSIVIVVTIAVLFLLQNSYREGLQARGLELARVIAHDQIVIDAVSAHNQQQPNISIQNYIESIRSKTDASYIVVVDANAIRLSHPEKNRLGKHFIGDDIYPVLNNGSEYSSVASGSLGEAIRNFSPIIADHQVIGAICIGYLSNKISDIIFHQHLQIGALIGLVYLLGIVTTVAFLLKIKRTFLDYEPEVIVNKFREHEMVFESIRDALIAVDSDVMITMINSSAVKAFSLGMGDKTDYINQPLARYSAALNHLILDSKGGFEQGEFAIGNTNYRVNSYPITTTKGLQGYAIAFFTHLDPNELEKEVIYLKNYAELLRSKTHEYSNKLNTLSGMLQMQRYEQAIDFIQQETDRYQSVINNIVLSVSDSAVAGLLLAKFNKASDMGVKYTIDLDTNLASYEKQVSEKLVTILGNLIDNALLAAWQNRQQQIPEIWVYLSDRSHYIIIEIQDNGAGIREDLVERILEFGISSKADDQQSGIGLYLVKQLVDYFEGSIDWERTEQDTTLFSIYLDKKEAEHHE